MGEVSELLSEAINSIIDAKEENDIDSLFKKRRNICTAQCSFGAG